MHSIEKDIIFKNAIENCPVPMIMVDSKRTAIYHNKIFADIFGYTLEDISSFDEWWNSTYPHEGNRDQIIDILDSVSKRSDHDPIPHHVIERQVMCKDGSVKYIESQLRKTDKGRYLITFIDLTKHKVSDQLLAEPEKIHDELIREKETAQSYLDIADVMIIAVDPGIRVTLINKKGCQILGYSEEELLGVNGFELCMPIDSRPTYVHYFSKVVTGEVERLGDIELPVVTKAGDERIIRWYVVPIIEDSTITGVLVCGNDVTEYKMAEKALTLDELRLEALVELNQMGNSTENAVIHFALEKVVKLTGSNFGYIAFVDENDSVTSMYSCSDDPTGIFRCKSHPTEFFSDEDDIWGEAIRQRKPIVTNDLSVPKPLKRAGLKDHLAIGSHLGVPIFDERKIISVVGVGNKKTNYDSSDIRQITLLMEGLWKIIKKRQYDARLKGYAEELSRKNSELASLDIQKDQFLSSITHELKTPLISIKGYSDLLSEGQFGSLNEEQKAAVDNIVQGSERLQRLIDSILYLQDITAGKVEYGADIIQIKDHIEKILNDMSLITGDRVTTIKTNISRSLPLIRGNSVYFEQVFFHIIDNALKFTPEAGSIEISAFSEDGHVHVVVEDSGIGISQEKLQHIFERFYQGDGSLNRKYGGNGIGLHLCKTIIEAHGGNIWAESEDGKGTKIHVLLPAALNI